MTEDRLNGLSLPECAELLGVASEEFTHLAETDARIISAPTLWGNGFYRLREWLRAGQPLAALDTLAYVGDSSIEQVVREVLVRVPAPVRWHIVSTCTIVGVGRPTAGWVSEHPDPPARSAESLMGLSSSDAAVIAHECGHLWLGEPVSPRAPRSARSRGRASEEALTDLSRAAVANDDIGWLEEFLLEPELAADRAARCWGFSAYTCGSRRIGEIRASIYHRAERAAADRPIQIAAAVAIEGERS